MMNLDNRHRSGERDQGTTSHERWYHDHRSQGRGRWLIMASRDLYGEIMANQSQGGSRQYSRESEER